MSSLCVVVVGSRRWTNGARVRADLTKLYNELGPEDTLFLVEAGSPGAEAHAGAWGRHMHYHTRFAGPMVSWASWPPSWVRGESMDWRVRNEWMLNWVVLSFPEARPICLAYPEFAADEAVDDMMAQFAENGYEVRDRGDR